MYGVLWGVGGGVVTHPLPIVTECFFAPADDLLLRVHSSKAAFVCWCFLPWLGRGLTQSGRVSHRLPDGHYYTRMNGRFTILQVD